MRSDDAATIRDVLAAEHNRVRALLNRDAAMLDNLLASDLHYIHASARIDSKAGLLASLRSGRVTYRAGELTDLEVRPRIHTAIATGHVCWETTVEGIDRIVNARFVDVWTRDTTEWQLSFACLSPLPPTSPEVRDSTAAVRKSSDESS